MYGITADDKFDGNALPILPPGIYDNATFLGVKNETGLKKDDGTALTDRVTFNFKTEDGQPFSHSELDQGTDEKKGKNLATRVAHILTKLGYTKEQMVQSNTSWASYAAWVTQMGNAVVPNKPKVKLKISGSVYEGKAKSRFNGYPPFIAKAGEDLGFDANDLKGNAEYAQHQSPKPDAPQGSNASKPSEETVGKF